MRYQEPADHSKIAMGALHQGKMESVSREVLEVGTMVVNRSKAVMAVIEAENQQEVKASDLMKVVRTVPKATRTIKV